MPIRLTKKEILALREKARQRPADLLREAAEKKAREDAILANRQQFIAKAQTEAAFAAKSARRKELLESTAQRRASVVADWEKNRDKHAPLRLTGESEIGIDSGTAKPLALIRRR